MSLNQLYVQSLEQAQGSLEAAKQDLQGEEITLRDGGVIDDGMIDGALFHAQEAVAKITRLRDALRSVAEAAKPKG